MQVLSESHGRDVLEYAETPRRRRSWVGAALVAASLIVIFEFGVPRLLATHYQILRAYWAQQRCLRCDPSTLPAVRLSYAGSSQLLAVTGGTVSRDLATFQQLGSQLTPPAPARNFNLAILLYRPGAAPRDPFRAVNLDLLAHDSVRPDGQHRLVYIYTNDNYISAKVWPIATVLHPAKSVTDTPDILGVILPAGHALSIKGMLDSADSRHLMLRAVLSGTSATSGTIEVVLHNDDTIDLQPSFGWMSKDARHLWAPAGKPTDADVQSQQ